MKPTKKKLKDKKITAKITGAINNGRQIEGYIQDDSRGRWRDGTFIRTSDIVKTTNTKDGILVETLNSIYLVELIGDERFGRFKSVSKQV